jgi:site-specific DNA recombinase
MTMLIDRPAAPAPNGSAPAKALRAAIYVRVSTTDQEEGTSLGTQEQRCRLYAEAHGYLVDERYIYREVFTGAALHQRPMLSQLRAAVRSGEVDVLVCYALDRLSRDQVHVAIVLDDLEKAGVRLEFVTETFENSTVGKFILSAKAFAAELEREKIRERSLRGKRAEAEAGRPLSGGWLLYGYRWADANKREFAPHPETARWVRKMFELAAQGWTLRRIVGHLNDLAVPTARGKARLWARTTVHGMLTNATYAGRRVAFRYVSEKTASGKIRMVERPADEQIPLPDGKAPPALVSPEVFGAVRERLRLNQQRSSRNNRYPESALLRAGFAVCGHCGGSMAVKRVGPGGKYFHYRCIRGLASKHACPAPRGSEMSSPSSPVTPNAVLAAGVESR